MNRFVPIVVLSLSVAGCMQARKGEGPPYPGFTDAGVGAQQRIGRYLQDSVVTNRLRECWGRLQGEGAVALDLTYRKAGGTWTFEGVKATKSTLRAGQDAAAQRCVEDAARGTTFPLDAKQPLETAAEAFIVRLAWPVPLPAAGTQMSQDQIARMIGTGGGGVITVPGCSDCVPRTEYPYGLKCESKSSGSNVDCEEISSNVCATTPKACLRGIFGGSVGVIMY